MTIKRTGTLQTDFLMQICEPNSRPMARMKVGLRPWLELAIALTCLALGVRLLIDSGALISLIGFALLIRFPAYCYFAWRDYRAMNESRVALSLEWYLEDQRGARPERVEWRRHSMKAESLAGQPSY